MEEESKTKWFTLTSEETLKKLGVEEDQGLSDEEVKKRVEKYGRNELKEKPKKTLIQKLKNVVKRKKMVLKL